VVTPLDANPTELLGRIQSLERQLATLSDIQSEQGSSIQQVVESSVPQVKYQHQNLIRNGDLDFDRNRYLYDTDFAGGTGEDGNVSLEAAHMYSHPKDTAIDTTGSVGAASAALTITTPDFIAGDAGLEIVVYGAGAAGSDLVTTISGAPGSTTTCTLAVAATTAVTGARVRFRLLQLKEDSTDVNADASLATNTALKTSTHTRYATTVSNPDYDKTNGWIRWSDAANTITCPLPFNLINPSKQFIVSFLYKLANDVDSEAEVFADFYAGVWDNTAGQRKFLEGTKPTLSGTAQGTTGATSRDYFVLMYLSDGSTVGTDVVTVANTNATPTPTNYVSLSWSQDPGVVKSEVYRKTGATYERLGFPYPAHTYYDNGTVNNTVVGFPTPTHLRRRAVTQITTANFAKASSAEWRLGQMNIVIPKDYDSSKTTDKQWFVMGMNTGFSGTGSDHALLIDKISLDETYGIFSKSPLDFFAKRQVSTSASSGDQGTSGTGGPVIDPGGGIGCPVFEELIETDQGKVRAIDLVDNEADYKVIDRNGDAVTYLAEIMPPQEIYTLIAGPYKITASASHPVFTDVTDLFGKPLSRFAKDDIIYTKSGNVAVDFTVRRFRKRHTVRISLKGPEKGYWQGGVAVHNRKPDPFIE
jgi:hypothetical protein